MALASDNVFPKIIEGMQTSDPAAPADSSWKIYAKANGIFARSSNGITGPFTASGSAATITTVDATLSGDVTIGTNSFTDGMSASFASGTWLIHYKGVFALATTSQTHDVTMRLVDSGVTTTYDECSNGLQVNNTSGTIGLEVVGFAIVTLGGTTTLKVQATDIRASTVMKRDVTSNSNTSHTASRLVGYKVT